MICGLATLFRVAAELRGRDFLHGVVAAAAVILLGAVSLGFGTFAAYVYLRASEGRVVAALIVGVVYGLPAIMIWATYRRASRFRRAAVASAPASWKIASLIEALAEAGTLQDQLALVAAMRLGRELKPIQLLAMALIGGNVAGRKIGEGINPRGQKISRTGLEGFASAACKWLEPLSNGSAANCISVEGITTEVCD